MPVAFRATGAGSVPEHLGNTMTIDNNVGES